MLRKLNSDANGKIRLDHPTGNGHPQKTSLNSIIGIGNLYLRAHHRLLLFFNG